MHSNQRFTQVCLASLLLAFVVLLGLWPATPVARAGSPAGPAQARHYRADETPPGLIASEWQQITAQVAQQIYLKASNTGVNDSFGWSVALDGDTLVVAAPDEDSSATGVNGNQTNNSATEAGAAYVFTRSGSTWSQQAYLKASNTATGDSFGISVALDGDTLVVGANGEDSSAGAAYVFTRPTGGTTWSQQAYLKASNPGFNNEFGVSVALSGETLAVGAVFEDSNATGVGGDGDNDLAPGAGAAYTFTGLASSTSTIYLPLLVKN
jgi:hypothetical protein